MSQDQSAASQPVAAPAAQTSDVQQRRGNVSVDRLAAILAQGEQTRVQSGSATLPDPIPEKPKPVAATPTTPETPAAPDESKPASTEASTAKSGEDVATTQTEEDATETQDGEEEVLSQDPKDQKHKLTPEQQEVVNKRIGKEVAKTKRLATELETLKAEIEALKQSKAEPADTEAPIVVQPTPDNPLAHVQDAAALDKEIQNARAYKYWAEDALDSDGIENGYVYQGQTFSKSQIKEIRRNATRILEEFAPARQRFLEAKNQVAQKAVETFPFLKDRNSPDYVLAQQIRREFPELSLRPNGDLIVAEIVKGRRAIEAEKASAGKPAAPAKTRATAPKAHAETPAAVPSTRATEDDVQREKTQREVQQIRGQGNLSTKKLAEMFLKTAALKS